MVSNRIISYKCWLIVVAFAFPSMAYAQRIDVHQFDDYWCSAFTVPDGAVTLYYEMGWSKTEQTTSSGDPAVVFETTGNNGDKAQVYFMWSKNRGEKRIIDRSTIEAIEQEVRSIGMNIDESHTVTINGIKAHWMTGTLDLNGISSSSLSVSFKYKERLYYVGASASGSIQYRNKIMTMSAVLMKYISFN